MSIYSKSNLWIFIPELLNKLTGALPVLFDLQTLGLRQFESNIL